MRKNLQIWVAQRAGAGAGILPFFFEPERPLSWNMRGYARDKQARTLAAPAGD